MIGFVLAVFVTLIGVAGADDTAPKLTCGQGPHDVYEMMFVPCSYYGPGYMHQRPDLKIDNVSYCRTFSVQEWSDWPMCGGATKVVRHSGCEHIGWSCNLDGTTNFVTPD